MTNVPGKTSVKGDQITYGPFEDVTPFDSGAKLRVHYVSTWSDRPSYVICIGLESHLDLAFYVVAWT